MQKYNDNSDQYEDWTTKKLKREAKEYHQLINVVECYGSTDLHNLDAILQELYNRGIEFDTQLTFNG